MSRIEIPVEGMSCEGCERTVEAALTRIEGVRDAEADHRAKRVRVSFDPELVDEQRLRAQIEQAGYEPVVEEVGWSWPGAELDQREQRRREAAAAEVNGRDSSDGWLAGQVPARFG